MAKVHAGRKAGGCNRGYYYRKGRGWYALDGKKQVALRYEDGTPIKDAKAHSRDVREAMPAG